MVSISNIIGTFPPASLAGADLCRFLTRLLNRRSMDEMASMRTFCLVQPIPGFPANLSPVLVEVIETLRRNSVDPASLDPESVESLFSSRDFQNRLDARTPLVSTPLRPGNPVSSEVRDLLGAQLHTVQGVGDKLVLVTPVEVVSLEGLGWGSPRQASVARLMQSDEAEVLRLTWAAIEECFGWASARLRPWAARFIRIAMRNNLPAAEFLETIRDMPTDERLALWRVLVEHNRDLELSDAYRPGSKGLQERLQRAQIHLEDGVLRVLLPVVRQAYQGCQEDPNVAAGYCPVSTQDLESYAARVDVTPAAKERLERYSAEEIEVLLRDIAVAERQHLELDLADDVRRDLRGFRDTLLARRYRRDVGSLWGVDPRIYASAQVQLGSDRGAISRALKALVDEARHTSQAAGMGLLAESASAGPDLQVSMAFGDRRRTVELQTEEGTIDMTAENPFVGQPDAPQDEEVEELKRPSLPMMKNPFRQDEMNDLPPLPAAPARTRPPTETKIELPPMPTVPLRRKHERGSRKSATDEFDSLPLPSAPVTRPSVRQKRLSPTEEFESLPLPDLPVSREPQSTRRRSPTEEFDATPLPEAPPLRTSVPDETRKAPVTAEFRALPEPRPPRPPTSAQLVTPSQAVEFYRKAFRELQVMERDLLERGPWQEAAERLEALGVQTVEIVAALGPSARSGDHDFERALKKVQVVESYLKRVLPLLGSEFGPSDDASSAFSGFFRKKK